MQPDVTWSRIVWMTLMLGVVAAPACSEAAASTGSCRAAECMADGAAGVGITLQRTSPPAAPAAAARIRSSMLYRAGEFSTFLRQSPPSAHLPRETGNRMLPLDRHAEDKWLAMDKAKHVAFSFLWTLGTQYAAVNKGGLSEHRALPISVTSSALIGVTKEYYDLNVGPTRHFSGRDLVADAVGILLAVGVILL